MNDMLSATHEYYDMDPWILLILTPEKDPEKKL